MFIRAGSKLPIIVINSSRLGRAETWGENRRWALRPQARILEWPGTESARLFGQGVSCFLCCGQRHARLQLKFIQHASCINT